MLKFLATFGATLCLLLAPSDAREWTVDTYPNPNTSDGSAACRRGNVKGSVCDPDGFIATESADVVEGHIKQIESAEAPYASSGCRQQHADYSPGFQVAVALASSVVKKGHESSADAAARFANQLFDAWGVGNAECGNGILLLVAFDDRQAHIAQGELISHFASQNSLSAVIENMKPKLKEGKYGPAVEQAVIDLGLVLAGADPSPESSSEGFPYWVLGIIGSIVGFIGWGIWKGSKQKNECMSLLDKLQQEQETAKLTGKYPAASCPICFEDLKPIKAAQPSAPPMEQTTEAVGDLSASLAAASPSQPLLSKRKSRERVDEKVDELQQESSLPAGESEDDDKKPPLCLPCGHTFCKDCLSEWLTRNSNCPICREEVGRNNAGGASGYALTTRGHGIESDLDEYERGHRHGLDGYQRELAFRMHRLQRRYPQYIPSSAISSGSGYVDFSSMRQQMMQPVSRSNFQHSGHQGSSISFGGGTHSGQGVGGGW